MEKEREGERVRTRRKRVRERKRDFSSFFTMLRFSQHRNRKGADLDVFLHYNFVLKIGRMMRLRGVGGKGRERRKGKEGNVGRIGGGERE